MIVMKYLTEKLTDLLQSLSISDWGIADITGLHPLGEKFQRALSMLMAYSPQFNVYNEGRYHKLLKEIGSKLDEATLEVSRFFESNQIKHFSVPQGGQDPKTLLAMFPHKLAAVRGGMGWIGKSSLLITNKYGPRVRLATILIDYNVPCDEPVTTSKCGGCKECVEACPYNCIKNVDWYPGISREELFDAHKCSAKREAFIKSIGHKHECGLCLLSCPHGESSGRVRIGPLDG